MSKPMIFEGRATRPNKSLNTDGASAAGRC